MPGLLANAAGEGGVRSPADRREEILDVASRSFATSGLRASLRDIADALGIKPGSLYHHFDSKDAIVVALMQRYHTEFDRLAVAAAAELDGLDPELVPKYIARLGAAITECAVRHGTAVQLTFYEPPAGSSYELMRLSGRTPTGIESVMLETFRMAQSSGYLRTDIDPAMLADRFCESMLYVGLGMFHVYQAYMRVAEVKCDIMMNGIATVPPLDTDLDRSQALRAVDEALRVNERADQSSGNERHTLIRRAATEEFARRGYEATTLRDIAAAAGVGTGSVYRAIGSKEELLASIMNSFSEKIIAGWDAALGADATTMEKLDALTWLHLNVMEQFSHEFRIQLGWLRQTPLEATNVAWSFPAVLQQLQALLTEGAERGEIRIQNPAEELTATCVLELTWVPQRILRIKGKRAALIHARDTVLRGVANR